MTLYQWLLFGHVLAAIIWVGGGIMDLLVSRRMAGKGEAVEEAVTDFRAWTGMKVFGPSAFAVLVFGILLVLNNSAWSFSQTWVWLSLVLVVLLIAIGAGYFGPEEQRIKALREERGSDDPEFQRRSRRLERIAEYETVVFLVILFLMIFKPGA
jgi:uncharacterized membrane protein